MGDFPIANISAEARLHERTAQHLIDIVRTSLSGYLSIPRLSLYLIIIFSHQHPWLF